MSQPQIQVLVVDDSVVVRGLLTRALQSDPDIVVAGTAGNGESALSQMKRMRFDAVVMDVEMPILDGLETLKIIQKDHPGTPVIMASTLTRKGAAITVQALASGAAGCVEKPQADSAGQAMKILADQLIPLVKGVAGKGSGASSPTASAPVVTPPRPRTVGTGSLPGTARSTLGRGSVKPQILVIGSSTGGPQALSRIMHNLSDKVHLPIFITQHMPAAFTPILAEHLARDAKRPAKEAVDGEEIHPGCIYVAPGNHHMYLDRQGAHVVTRLNQAPPEHFCRPSVNPLYRSAAEIYGHRVLAVTLTGMGEDGIEGAHELHAKGAHIIAQDEASSVVWGMPGAVAKADLADEILNLEDIARRINQLCAQEVSLV